MERYIIFVRDNRTGAEFIATRRDLAGLHDKVCAITARRYPAPDYTVHTAYTEVELKNILSEIQRWTGQTAPSVTALFSGNRRTGTYG